MDPVLEFGWAHFLGGAEAARPTIGRAAWKIRIVVFGRGGCVGHFSHREFACGHSSDTKFRGLSSI